MRRRATGRALLSALLAALLVGGLPGIASAHAGRHHYFQYNMYGRLGNGGSLAPANRVINHRSFMESGGHAPVGISLQEVCRNPSVAVDSQFELIKQQIPGFQWEFFWLADTTTTNCQQYGITVGSVGTSAGARLSELLPDSGEDRGVLCERSVFFGLTLSACSTHLKQDNDVWAANQLNAALWHADQFNANGGLFWRYFGGDFNITPAQMDPANNAYPGRVEADPVRQFTSPVPNPTEKIDYGFVSSVWFKGSNPMLWATAESDHALLEGHFIPK